MSLKKELKKLERGVSYLFKDDDDRAEKCFKFLKHEGIELCDKHYGIALTAAPQDINFKTINTFEGEKEECLEEFSKNGFIPCTEVQHPTASEKNSQCYEELKTCSSDKTELERKIEILKAELQEQTKPCEAKLASCQASLEGCNQGIEVCTAAKSYAETRAANLKGALEEQVDAYSDAAIELAEHSISTMSDMLHQLNTIKKSYEALASDEQTAHQSTNAQEHAQQDLAGHQKETNT